MDTRSLALAQFYFLRWACDKELWHVKLPNPNYGHLLSALKTLGHTVASQAQPKNNIGRENFYNKEFFLGEFKDKIEKAEKEADSGFVKEATEDHRAVALPTKELCRMTKGKKTKKITDDSFIQAQYENDESAKQKNVKGRVQIRNNAITFHQLSDKGPVPSGCTPALDSKVFKSSQSCRFPASYDSENIMSDAEPDPERDRIATKTTSRLREKSGRISYEPVAGDDVEPGAYEYLLRHISEEATSALSDISESWLDRFEVHDKTNVTPIRFSLVQLRRDYDRGNRQEQHV